MGCGKVKQREFYYFKLDSNSPLLPSPPDEETVAYERRPF